jgi:hypothetical protein
MPPGEARVGEERFRAKLDGEKGAIAMRREG